MSIDQPDDPLPPVPDGWEPPNLRTSAGGVWTVDDYVDASFREDRAGISGLWFPENNAMVITPRRAHHNDQLAHLDQRGVLGRRLRGNFFPWVWDLVSGNGVLNFPRSAGGAFQYMTRNDPPNVTYLQGRSMVDEGDVYSVVYACRRVDVPGESETEGGFLPSDSRFEKGSQTAREVGVRRMGRPVGDWYREMEFAGVLPDPAFERGLD